MNSTWNKQELPGEWKELINEPIYKKGDKTDCSNYKGISLLSTMHKIDMYMSKLRVLRLKIQEETVTSSQHALLIHMCVGGRKMQKRGRGAGYDTSFETGD